MTANAAFISGLTASTGELDDVFDLQDEIRRAYRAGHRAVQVRDAEIKRGTGSHKGLASIQRPLSNLGGERSRKAPLAETACTPAKSMQRRFDGLRTMHSRTHRFYLRVRPLHLDVERCARMLTRGVQLTTGIVPGRWTQLPARPGSVSMAPFAERKFDRALAAFERIAETAPWVDGNAFSNLAVAKMQCGPRS